MQTVKDKPKAMMQHNMKDTRDKLTVRSFINNERIEISLLNLRTQRSPGISEEILLNSLFSRILQKPFIPLNHAF